MGFLDQNEGGDYPASLGDAYEPEEVHTGIK